MLPCEDVFKNGQHVFTVANIPAAKIEEWVKAVALLSGQDVDWHFVGGRGVVLALGDISQVRQAIWALRSDLPPEATTS